MRYGATGSMSGRRTFFGQTGRRLIGPGATGQAVTFRAGGLPWHRPAGMLRCTPVR